MLPTWSLHRLFFLIACIIPLALALESNWNQEARDITLDIHNDYRRDEGGCRINKMVYDMELEAQAKTWAEGCMFKHEIKEGRGENLAYDTSDIAEADLIKSASKHWFDEKKDYTYGQPNCDKSCHYTQMVWDDTTHIGCYSARCPTLQYAFTKDTAWYFVCFYTPMGNWYNEKPYEKTCDSPCHPGQTEENGLCVGGDQGSETDEVGQTDESTGTDESTHTGENTGTDEGTQTGESTGTDESTQTGESTGTDEGTQTGESAGTDEGTQTGESTGTDESTQTGESAGTDEGTQTGESTGTDEGTQTGESTGTDESTEKGGGCSGSSKTKCEDDHPNCKAWAASNQCTKNPGYMLIHCEKSCNVCESEGDESKPDGECKDDHTSCGKWAKNDQCTENPGYMLIHCKQSCGEC